MATNGRFQILATLAILGLGGCRAEAPASAAKDEGALDKSAERDSDEEDASIEAAASGVAEAANNAPKVVEPPGGWGDEKAVREVLAEVPRELHYQVAALVLAETGRGRIPVATRTALAVGAEDYHGMLDAVESALKTDREMYAEMCKGDVSTFVDDGDDQRTLSEVCNQFWDVCEPGRFELVPDEATYHAVCRSSAVPVIVTYAIWASLEKAGTLSDFDKFVLRSMTFDARGEDDAETMPE